MNKKVLYVIIILLIITILVALYYYYSLNAREDFKNLNKFKFITDDDLSLSDDFGDIIKENVEFDKLNEYREGFEVSTIHKEHFNQEEDVNLLSKIDTPRNVFTYWENKNNRKEPFSHIKLCFETMKKHYKKYNFVILNPITIKQYLPDIRNDLDNLMIAQKVDYYRIALLQKFGGIWIDADTIALKDLDTVFDKLDNGYDFVGFGCTGKICFNGYPEPSNGVMGSRQNGLLMTKCLNKLDKMLDSNNKNYKYFDLGKKVIWECMDDLKPYSYYHFPSQFDGSRDIDGYWIHSPHHLSKNHTKLLNENDALFIFLANYELMNDDENKWFLELNTGQILNGDWWISSLFRKALKN